jgi:hypothetical protein
MCIVRGIGHFDHTQKGGHRRTEKPPPSRDKRKNKVSQIYIRVKRINSREARSAVVATPIPQSPQEIMSYCKPTNRPTNTESSQLVLELKLELELELELEA